MNEINNAVVDDEEGVLLLKINKMADQIKSELKDASDYIKCAIEYKVSDPELSFCTIKIIKS